jgi:MscS family membrane protein
MDRRTCTTWIERDGDAGWPRHRWSGGSASRAKTLENLLGRVSLLMDKAVQVGDFCKIGDRLGTVEDVGLRSLKLRTLDQNLLVVPNGSLAQMQFENMTSRSKLLINQNFSLRIETKVDQLRCVLDNVQSMLNDDPAIESGTSRLRVTQFAGAAFELELFAHANTGDWTNLLPFRQDVILKIAEIIEAAGTGLTPTRLTYGSSDAGVDPERANDFVRRVTELRLTTRSGFQAKPNGNEIFIIRSDTGWGCRAAVSRR